MTSDTEVSKILAKTMMFLMETAAKDGLISDDEQELISTLDISLKKYERALQLAFLDGIITLEEQNQLERIKETIIDSGRVFAEVDGLSREEMNLLISVMLSLEIPQVDKD